MNERIKANIREDVSKLFEKYGLNWKQDKVARKVDIVADIIYRLFVEAATTYTKKEEK